MASPVTMGGNWPTAASSQQQMTMPPSEAEEMGVQVRQMGLKVHYTFDKDGCVNCLARWPQTLQVQAIAIDERNWIGVVDLRVCVQAIAQCSPEIVGQNDRDYTVYAFDYSEPETPLVGQGMLSWALQAAPSGAFPPDENAKMVTGRVTKNMLAIFGKGVRETLEVKLRLNEVPRMVQADTSSGQETSQSQAKGAPTPTDSAEWSSFLQSNPALGRSASISMMQSPSLAPVRPDMQNFQQPMAVPPPMAMATDAARCMSRPGSRPGSRPASRQSSMPPSSMAIKSGPPLLAPKPSASMGAGSPPNDDLAGASTPPAEISHPVPRPSRPSSRARSRQPTGRPRGRPRKRPPVDGNTSAAEEQPTDADADDGPKRKRAKTTKADYPTKASLDMAPESLRVAASTSGALRSLRPVLAGSSAADGSAAQGSHLQEIPRAPTPVPQGAPPSQNHARKMMAHKARRESLAGFDTSAFQDHMFARAGDARSPTDSVAPSPENYTPEDSPADIGSSPPVPRSATYMPQSSPIPSSPILPPMPRPQPDSGFMSGGMDDLFDEDECMNDAAAGAPPTPLDLAAPTPTAAPSQPGPPPAAETVTAAPFPTKAPTPTADAATSTNMSQTSRASTSANATAVRKNGNRSTEQYSFMAINPGPPELLPVTSIYNPPQQKPRPAKLQRTASSVGIRTATVPLKRSNSEPAQPPQPDEAQQAQTRTRQHSQQQQQQQPPFALPSETIDTSRPHPTETHPATQTNSAAATPTPAPQTMGIDGQSLNIDVDINELARLISENDEAANNLLHMPAARMEDVQSPQSQQPLPQFPPSQPNRSNSISGSKPTSSSRPTVPASDPAAMPPLTLPLPPPPTAFSEAPCPPSDMEPSNERSNKNLVRKAAIRERLQKAIESGEMPPFCQNCGAIETPTWRKMWTQDHDGEPGYHEYSEKPGHVTAIDILERNEEGKPIKYRLVKKALGPTDSGKLWKEMLLCNPCGIWLGKFKSHRPSDRWDKDASRLNQPRRKRTRSKKSNNTKSDAPLPPTSEAYFTTDPIGPADFDDASFVSAPANMAQMVDHIASGMAPSGDFDMMLAAPATITAASAAVGLPDDKDQNPFFQAGSNRGPASGSGGDGGSASSARRRTLGSTHSRGSGTANSPITVDDHFGSTRRLLFPSPRKSGVPKVLGELSVNVVASAPSGESDTDGWDNKRESGSGAQSGGNDASGETSATKATKTKSAPHHDDMADLFGTPPSANMRPSTPPPRSGGDGPGGGSGANGPFKTPTRPTPSHRPITRSISKSIRSGVSCPKSPGEQLMLLQRTPSKTPRSTVPPSTGKRRSAAASTPGRQGLHAPFHLDGMAFDSPFTSTLNQLLSEANDFTTGSPSHGLVELDLASLGNLESDGLAMGVHSSANIDFGSYLDTDLTLPSSSSPLLGRRTGAAGHHGKHHQVTFGEALTLKASESMWTDLSETIQADEVMDG